MANYDRTWEAHNERQRQSREARGLPVQRTMTSVAMADEVFSTGISRGLVEYGNYLQVEHRTLNSLLDSINQPVKEAKKSKFKAFVFTKDGFKVK